MLEDRKGENKMCKYCEKESPIEEIDCEEELVITYYYDNISTLSLKIITCCDFIERMWNIKFCPMCGKRLNNKEGKE